MLQKTALKKGMKSQITFAWNQQYWFQTRKSRHFPVHLNATYLPDVK